MDHATPEDRGWLGRYIPGLTREDRLALGAEATPEWLAWIGYYAPGLTQEDRAELRMLNPILS